MNREDAFLDSIINYEKETRLIKIRGEDIVFPDYTHLKIHQDIFTVSPSAYLSINNHIQVNGQGFSELSEYTKTNLYNEVLKNPRLSQKEFLIILTQESVKAVMSYSSSDKRSYTYIRTSEVLQNIKSGFENIGIGLEFLDGVFDDYYMVATYRLRKAYYVGYSFLITIIKSNSGYSSLKVLPVIEKGRLSAHMKEDELSFEHKGDVMEKIKTIPDTINKTFNRIAKRLEDGPDDSIEDVVEFCRANGLNIRTAKYIQKHFKGNTLMELLDFLENIDFTGPKGEPKEVIIGNLLAKK